jgi:hypothetical protein
MIVNRIILVALLCTLTVCHTTPNRPDPATGQDAGVADPAGQQALASQEKTDEDDMDKVICKTNAPVGSRIGARICLPRRRWIEMQNQGREMIEKANRRAITTPIPRAIDR